MSRPGTGARPTPSGAHADGGPRVLVAVQQLRRPVPGGIGTYARGLLQGLDEGSDADLEIALYASRRPSAASGDTHAGHDLGRHGAPGAGRADPLECYGRRVLTSRLPGPLLTRVWDRGRGHVPAGFDVVHSVSLAFPPARHRRGGPRTTVTVHDLSWRRFPEAATPRGRRWHEAALGRALRTADAFVVPSDAVGAELVTAGAPADAVTVIPAGADHLPSPDEQATTRLLQSLGVHGPYLLTVGTLEPRKNLPELFAAYAQALPSLPAPFPLLVVGPEGWGDTTMAGAPPGVRRTGPVADAVLAGLYARARAFAYVPLTEGYGLPPLEAMVFGVPVVAGTGVPSVVPRAGEPDRPAALRVAAGDTGAIARALVVATTDEAQRADLVDAGRRLAAGRTWRRAAAQHVALWRAVAPS